jgi:hypothetical protein
MVLENEEQVMASPQTPEEDSNVFLLPTGPEREGQGQDLVGSFSQWKA